MSSHDDDDDDTREGPGAGGSEAIARPVDKLIEQNRIVVDEAGTVFRYNGRSWEECGDAELNKLALDVDDSRLSSIARRREIIELLKGRRMIPGLRGKPLAANRLAGRGRGLWSGWESLSSGWGATPW